MVCQSQEKVVADSQTCLAVHSHPHTMQRNKLCGRGHFCFLCLTPAMTKSNCGFLYEVYNSQYVEMTGPWTRSPLGMSCTSAHTYIIPSNYWPCQQR